MSSYQITREKWDMTSGRRTMVPVSPQITLNGNATASLLDNEEDAKSLAAALAEQDNANFSYQAVDAPPA